MSTLPLRLPALAALVARPDRPAAVQRSAGPRGEDGSGLAGPATGGDGSGLAGQPLPPAVPLTALPRHATGRVAGVRVPVAADGVSHDPAMERLALRLIEIGFVAGEHLRVVAFGQPGDDPIGVRIGGRGGVSTFALRRVEAACVWVVPAPAPGI